MADPFTLVPLADTRPRPPRHAALAALIAFVLVAGVAAALLLPDDSKRDPVALVRAASSRTEAETTSHFTATIDLTLNGTKMPALVTMTGAGDTATKVASIVIEGAGFRSEIRRIDGLTYMNVPGAALPEGKQWVSLDPAQLDPSIKNRAPDQGDFFQQLELLDGFVGEPDEVGHEQLDGVDVTHYRLSLNFEALLDEMQRSGKALNANQMLSALDAVKSAVDLTDVPGEVWLDDAGRARRFIFRLHVDYEGQTLDEVADMRFGQFGEPVVVEAPPAEEVVPFSEVPDFFNRLPR